MNQVLNRSSNSLTEHSDNIFIKDNIKINGSIENSANMSNENKIGFTTPQSKITFKKSTSMENSPNTENIILKNLDFTKELEDPGNLVIKSEIEKIMFLQSQVNLLKSDYEKFATYNTSEKKLLEEEDKNNDSEKFNKFIYNCNKF
jgi:hypothetical protein